MVEMSEDRYKKLIRHEAFFKKSPDLCYQISPDGKILDVNSKATRVLGLPKKILIGKSIISTVYTPESQKKARALLKECKKESHIYSDELKIKTKTGKAIDVELHTRLVKDKNSKKDYLIVIQKVDSGNKQTENMFELERKQLLSIFENIDEPVYIIDPGTYEILYVNKVLKKTFGNIIGKECYHTLQGLEAPCSFCTNDRIFGKNLGKTYIWEFQNKVNNRWYRCIDKAIRWPDGRLVRYEMAIDITDSKQVNKSLKESEALYRALIKTAPDAVTVTDLEGKITEASEQTAKIHGYRDVSQLIGLDAFKLIAPEDHDSAKENLEKAFKDGSVRDVEYTFIKKDGSRFIGELNATLALDAFGKPHAFVGSVRDITERKQAEENLEKAMNKLRAMMEGTIQAMALTVETRDPHTTGHQNRVAQLAIAIADEMDLPENERQGISVGATIHDIGKMHIPAEILSKPSQLSETEFNIVKTHTVAGYNILKEIEFPWPVAQMALQHHERMNGSGYPNGISGREIIQPARILAVADVVEAMSSHRPYRSALRQKKVLNEISDKKGKLYDPDVSDACLKLFRKNGFKLQPHSTNLKNNIAQQVKS